MLIEIPSMAQNQFTMNKQTASRTFRKLVEAYDTHAFHLAPENYRDFIVFAARALNQSDWKSAVDNVFSIPMLMRMPEYQDEKFRTSIIESFKKAAFESFLYRSAKQYKSFCLKSLSDMFGLSKPAVIKQIAQMIMQNKLQMNIDAHSDLLFVNEGATDIKELQQLSLQYVS
jgi:hypothetical protein